MVKASRCHQTLLSQIRKFLQIVVESKFYLKCGGKPLEAVRLTGHMIGEGRHYVRNNGGFNLGNSCKNGEKNWGEVLEVVLTKPGNELDMGDKGRGCADFHMQNVNCYFIPKAGSKR